MTITRLLQLPLLPFLLSTSTVRLVFLPAGYTANQLILTVNEICRLLKFSQFVTRHERVFKVTSSFLSFAFVSLSGSIKYSSNGPKETEAALI